ncbi:MAG: tetratricopeptide repeat protein [Candidatus Edwardsbacteria bacterium]|nr:tetratricopeptide repeat protein [Candidatus Edwardsbacteria bacterium]MBU1577348.1 tetratricopeptide repeat protein [Candidatus Edwardsbacteria bacterium]MBU2463105.1 tetratricopeptide repeat protein [Candidatus Edwardsbacteria bacterium]MBU2594183.1 tetratricopeptide repeat protein [Candidatus Edwardsbacteria bacterium]
MRCGAVNWIKNNGGAGTTEDISSAVPFTIWQRQWEVCDVIGDRARARSVAEKVNSLSPRNSRYAITAGLYLSQLHIYNGEYQKALEQAKDTLVLALNRNQADLLANIYEQLSSAHQNLSNFDQAVEHTQKAMNIYSAAGNQPRLGSSLARLGQIYWKMGQYPKALPALDRAKQIFQENSDERSLALVLLTTANVLLATDEPSKAQEYYLASLAICRRIGDLAKQSTLHNNLGAIMYSQADYTGSLEHYRLGLRIDETLGNLHGQSTKLSNIAVMQALMGNHDQALANFEKGLRIEQATGNQDGQMRKLGNLATLYSLKGDFHRAIVYIDQALEICRKINSRSYHEFYLTQKVGYLGNIKDYQGAKALGEEAIEMSKSSGNQSHLVTLYSSLADIYYDTGEIEPAWEYSSRAVGIIESQELFEVNKEDSYFTHCLILEKQGRQKESDNYLELAYKEVQAKAGNIKDEKERTGFLSKNRSIARIVEKWDHSHSKKT